MPIGCRCPHPSRQCMLGNVLMENVSLHHGPTLLRPVPPARAGCIGRSVIILTDHNYGAMGRIIILSAPQLAWQWRDGGISHPALPLTRPTRWEILLPHLMFTHAIRAHGIALGPHKRGALTQAAPHCRTKSTNPFPSQIGVLYHGLEFSKP